MEKIILGIDPGTNLMGYGVIKVTVSSIESPLYEILYPLN